MTHEEVENEFWRVFPLLPANIQSTIKTYWKVQPKITTNKDVIDFTERLYLNSPINKAGTIGTDFFFRLDKLSKEELTEAIVHEFAHTFIFARDRASVLDYLSGRNMSYDEWEATYLTAQWMKIVGV